MTSNDFDNLMRKLYRRVSDIVGIEENLIDSIKCFPQANIAKELCIDLFLHIADDDIDIVEFRRQCAHHQRYGYFDFTVENLDVVSQ